MPNWDDLRFFLAVARGRTLTAAGHMLKVDATTVGRRIERLANSLNTSLFEASPGGLHLTSGGEKLLAYAEDMERSALAARDRISGERSRLTGTVRMSLSEGFATWMVARHLRAFQEMHPDIRLEIVTTNGFLNPSKREADLAVLLGRPQHGRLVAKKLTDYSLGLYAAHGYIHQHGAPVDRAALSAHPLIGYISDFIYAEELRYLDDIREGLVPHFSSSSINTQVAMTQSGLGIAVLPHFIGRQNPQLAPLLEDDVRITRSFWTTVHHDLQRVARVRAVIDWLNLTVARDPKLLV